MADRQNWRFDCLCQAPGSTFAAPAAGFAAENYAGSWPGKHYLLAEAKFHCLREPNCSAVTCAGTGPRPGYYPAADGTRPVACAEPAKCCTLRQHADSLQLSRTGEVTHVKIVPLNPPETDSVSMKAGCRGRRCRRRSLHDPPNAERAKTVAKGKSGDNATPQAPRDDTSQGSKADDATTRDHHRGRRELPASPRDELIRITGLRMPRHAEANQAYVVAPGRTHEQLPVYQSLDKKWHIAYSALRKNWGVTQSPPPWPRNDHVSSVGDPDVLAATFVAYVDRVPPEHTPRDTWHTTRKETLRCDH